MSDNSKFYDHILFIERLIENYKDRLDASLIKDLATQLNYIKEKQQDKLLNISVVGDFSTGKSTFINALLKHNLLEAEAMQSTTTASTIIEHARFYGIEVHYKNQKKAKKEKTGFLNFFKNFFSLQNDNIKKFKTFDELKTEIKNFGTSLEYSKDIEKINVYLPATTLNGVFRIIDTPGLNAQDTWLMDTTKSTIEKISDASVIIVDGEKNAIPENIVRFIKDNLSNVLSQSVFLLTRISKKTRRRERQIPLNSIIESIKKQIEHEFNLENPLILPYDSLEILKNSGEEEGDVNQEFLQITQKSEEELLNYVREKKKEVQSNKLISMIERFYGAVSGSVRTLQTGFENELAMLKRSKQSDLRSFVEKQKDERCKEYLDVFSEYFGEYKVNCYEASNECVSAFLEQVDKVQVNTAQDLQTWCEASFEQMTINLQKWMYDNFQLNQEAFKALDEVALAEVGEFQSVFEQHFKEFNLLNIRFDSSKLAIDTDLQNINTGFESQRYILNKAVQDENSSMSIGSFGGAAAASFMGALLLGPIGWIFGGMVGGGLGTFIGSLFGPSIDEIKGKIKESLEPNLHRIFKQTAEELIANYQNNLDRRCGFIRSELNRYLQSYQAEVDRRITEQENKRQYIEGQIRTIQLDLTDIDKHKQQILY